MTTTEKLRLWKAINRANEQHIKEWKEEKPA